MTAPVHDDALKAVSIVGIGNVLLGDDGFGPLVIEMFGCNYKCGSHVEVLDLGTPGLDIAPYLYDRDLVILIDAVRTGAAPGTPCILSEVELLNHRAHFNLTGHDPGIQGSLAHLGLAGHAPKELVVIGAEPQRCRFGEGISPSVVTAASVAVATIVRLLNERGVSCQSRHPATPLKLWWLSTANAPHGHSMF